MKIMRAAAIATIAGGLIGGGGIALASIPDSNGVVHACYHPQNDGHNTALTVIDTAKTHGACPSDQTELTWNQQGAQGPQGPAGPQGPQGPPGPAPAASMATADTHYDNPGYAGARTFPIVTVDCPAGTQAVNGGVLKVTADPGWRESALGSGNALPGSATEAWGQDTTTDYDPVRFSLPRPVNNGHSWKMAMILEYPYWSNVLTGQQNYQYGMTVTAFAECI